MSAVLDKAVVHVWTGTSFASSILSPWAFSIPCPAGINARLFCPEDCLLWCSQAQSGHLLNPSHRYLPAFFFFF